MICSYCSAHLHTDSHGKCKNCGAASCAEDIAESTMSDFCDFIAGTQQHALPYNLIAANSRRHGIIFPSEST